MSPQVPVNAQVQSPMGTPMGVQSLGPDFKTCITKGNVQVTPCRIMFTASNQGPIAITLHTHHSVSQETVVETDDCTGIATITGSQKTWSAMAGNTAGTCQAKFTVHFHNRNVGYAVLRIKNDGA